MAKPVVVVTGVSGNLGSRLLPLLGSFSVIGVDVIRPKPIPSCSLRAWTWDRNRPPGRLYELLRDTHPFAVIHLAFVIDPVRTGVLDVDRMWQINVAGTARVMEAVTEVNRTSDDGIKQFIFPSSVSVYGPDLPAPATEDSALEAHTLPYAIHKKESDEVVQQRCTALARMQRIHLAAAHFCRSQRRELPDGRVSRNAEWQGPARRKNARCRASVYLACCRAVSSISTTRFNSSMSTIWRACCSTSCSENRRRSD